MHTNHLMWKNWLNNQQHTGTSKSSGNRRNGFNCTLGYHAAKTFLELNRNLFIKDTRIIHCFAFNEVSIFAGTYFRSFLYYLCYSLVLLVQMDLDLIIQLFHLIHSITIWIWFSFLSDFCDSGFFFSIVYFGSYRI